MDGVNGDTINIQDKMSPRYYQHSTKLQTRKECKY